MFLYSIAREMQLITVDVQYDTGAAYVTVYTPLQLQLYLTELASASVLLELASLKNIECKYNSTAVRYEHYQYLSLIMFSSRESDKLPDGSTSYHPGRLI